MAKIFFGVDRATCMMYFSDIERMEGPKWDGSFGPRFPYGDFRNM